MTERIQQNIRASGQQPAAAPVAPVAPPRINLVHSPPQPARKLSYTPAGAGASNEEVEEDEDDDDDVESNTTDTTSKKRKSIDPLQSRRSAKKESKKQKKESPSGTFISNTRTFWGKQR
jgi:hypothetical protein